MTIALISFTITLLGCNRTNIIDVEKKGTITNDEEGLTTKNEREEVDSKVKEARAIEDIKLLSDKISEAEDIDSILKILDEYYNANNPKVYSAYFVNSEGKLYSSPRDEVDSDLRIRNWYKGAMKEEIYVSEKYESMASQKYIITIAKSVSKNNVNIGVLAIDKVAE